MGIAGDDVNFENKVIFKHTWFSRTIVCWCRENGLREVNLCWRWKCPWWVRNHAVPQKGEGNNSLGRRGGSYRAAVLPGMVYTNDGNGDG